MAVLKATIAGINATLLTTLGVSVVLALAISFGIFGSNVGAAWSGVSGTSGPYRYNEYTSETALYDVAKNELVWTGTVKTKEPNNVQTAIKSLKLARGIR